MEEHSPTALAPASFEAIRPRVIERLLERGIISHESDIMALTVIEEGFLNHLLILNLAGRELVVKYAARQGRKYHDLTLPSVRLRQEARAINWVAKNVDGSCVPEILSHGDDIIIMGRIPTRYRALSSLLFEGDLSIETAKQLGAFLGHLHNISAASAEVHDIFSDVSMLIEFKFRKIYDQVASDFAVVSEIDKLKEQLSSNRMCLVHGDFKADNIFVENRDFIVIDWEQSHFGNPALDLSYATHYLVMLSFVSEEMRLRCGRFIQSFIEQYLCSAGELDAKRHVDMTAKHIGVLLLFRLGEIERVPKGISREAKSELRALGKALIEGRAPSPLSF
jgi:aminoglycoside phosphotransferase (APT) family kinase protein